MALSRREEAILAAMEADLDGGAAASTVARGSQPGQPRPIGGRVWLLVAPQCLMVAFGVLWNFGIMALIIVIGVAVLVWLVVLSHLGTAPRPRPGATDGTAPREH